MMVTNLLIVDDDFDIRKSLIALLGIKFGEKILVSEAQSGNEAIGFYRLGKTFDIIVSDYNMSDGTGADLLFFLNLSGSNVPFILFSGEKNIKLPESGSNYLGVVDKTNTNLLIEILYLNFSNLGHAP